MSGNEKLERINKTLVEVIVEQGRREIELQYYCSLLKNSSTEYINALEKEVKNLEEVNFGLIKLLTEVALQLASISNKKQKGGK